ncbi:MAG TPA: isoprenylcysteine carboxylmethyltransferase family protein [Candidatus Eisenbacteria bacterium]|nr:isoprenylcysteine carboxylmethyltransferase family protein [Candidatus Eisenbacteria bacterium]
MRYLPLAGIAALFGIGVGWRAWLHRRRYGSWGIVLLSGGPAQVRRDGLLLLLLAVVIGAQAVVYALRPDAIAARMVMPPFDVSGAIVLFGGIALMVRAQLDLGASWRVGIDESAKPGLVTGGLYTLARNPIFTGMLLALAGLALLVPTWLSFIALAGGTIGIRRQVLQEEAYLRRTYGADYLAYATRVGRFVPGVGRLR